MWRLGLWLGIALAVLLIFSPSDTTGQSTTATEEVTFSKDVAPIFYQRCVYCHRPGEIAPMSLLSYREARPWARSIRQEVAAGRMPPWKADPHYGDFENALLLTEREKQTIVAWVDGGAQEGNPADMPSPPQFAEGWQIGEPDLVVEMNQEVTIPASGEIPYMTIQSDYVFEEDVYVQAIEVRPGNRSVVHHGIVLAIPEGDRRRQPDEDLHLYSPGIDALILRDGYAKVIRKGSRIAFSMHYNANGQEATDRTKVGFIFAKEPPHTTVYTTTIANRDLLIPPMVRNHEVVSALQFEGPSRIHAIRAHMHLRGKTATASLVRPDGQRQVLLHIPEWDDSWQFYYMLSEPARVEEGTILEYVSNFDNSPANAFNPDPNRTIPWGDQLWDEMQSLWMFWSEENEHNKDDHAPVLVPANKLFTTGIMSSDE